VINLQLGVYECADDGINRSYHMCAVDHTLWRAYLLYSSMTYRICEAMLGCTRIDQLTGFSVILVSLEVTEIGG